MPDYDRAREAVENSVREALRMYASDVSYEERKWIAWQLAWDAVADLRATVPDQNLNVPNG